MAEAVRLKYLESDNFAPGGGIGIVNHTVVSAKVKNTGFTKDVALHYQDTSGTWREQTLDWQANFGEYDLFSHSSSGFVTSQFVIRYSVNGATFWDNNRGSNYHVSEVHPNAVGGNVVLNKAVARIGAEAGGGFTFTTSWLEGEVFVNNLSFNKRVGVRLSTDDWRTFTDTNATFSSTHSVAEGASEVEVWKFKTPELTLNPSIPFFKFALFYQNVDTGELFWDNNFEQDYTLSKSNLSTDE